MPTNDSHEVQAPRAIIARRTEAMRAPAASTRRYVLGGVPQARADIGCGTTQSCVSRPRTINHQVNETTRTASHHHAGRQAREAYLRVLTPDLAADTNSQEHQTR